MGKKIKHMGMNLSKEGHEGAQKEGIRPERKPVNCFVIGGGFLGYCVSKGWLMQEGKGRNAKYFVTNIGKEELKKFGIKL
jgi:hypothetical protein